MISTCWRLCLIYSETLSFSKVRRRGRPQTKGVLREHERDHLDPADGLHLLRLLHLLDHLHWQVRTTLLVMQITRAVIIPWPPALAGCWSCRLLEQLLVSWPPAQCNAGGQETLYRQVAPSCLLDCSTQLAVFLDKYKEHSREICYLLTRSEKLQSKDHLVDQSAITGRDEPSRWLRQTQPLSSSPLIVGRTMLHLLWTTPGRGGSCSTGSPPPPSPRPPPSPPHSLSALPYALTLGLVFVVRTKADDQHAFPNLLIYRMTLREGLKEVGLLVLGTFRTWYFW